MRQSGEFALPAGIPQEGSAGEPREQTTPGEPEAASVLSTWVAVDPVSVRLLEEVRSVAASPATVLIRGESGSGKDLLATIVHYLSPRRSEPLVKIDCATLPVELVESELFGYERGAFTGATQSKRGRLELAGAGTIVLDEVAALSLPVQAKLLRVIEEKRFERLGGMRGLEVEARIVALSNVELERAVAEHSFRQDLYYRLNVIPVQVPALRQRPADIRPLAERFLKQLTEMHRKPQMSFAPAAAAALERYSYPGNVRELRNLVERAVIYGMPPEIGLTDLPPQVREAGLSEARSKMSLEELERLYIAEVLDYTRGKKSRAAQILGISRKTLLEKRKRYGLD